LKRATGKAKKEYLACICDEFLEFQSTGHYDLMYMQTKELGWKENHRIQNTGIEYLQGNIIVDQRQVLKIWELYDQPNQPENLNIKQKRPLYFAK
jgi:hypothetical protein